MKVLHTRRLGGHGRADSGLDPVAAVDAVPRLTALGGCRRLSPVGKDPQLLLCIASVGLSGMFSGASSTSA